MHVLMIEPSYYTQYPPLGLLKLSTYHKKLGDTVQFLRGIEGIRYLRTYPDKVHITSLFTYAWEPVWSTVRYCKMVFPKAEVWLGGVYASLYPEHAKESGADYVHEGIYPELEDELPDYSLIPKWHKEEKASVLFTSRGCIRKCSFCAVPALEGRPVQFRKTKSIRHLIHPDHTKVILWDNNILGEKHWPDVVDEIKELNLSVDFNQGLDARLITEEVAERFRGLKMPVVRIAYDFPGMGKAVRRALDRIESAGFNRRKVISYALYNFEDTPEDLFERVRDLLDWGATAYPMRYVPLNGPESLSKSAHIAGNWTPEQLEMVARARRVIGYGGAFPPYEGLRKKFLKARNFEEAFSLRERKRFAPRTLAELKEFRQMGFDHQWPTHATT